MSADTPTPREPRLTDAEILAQVLDRDPEYRTTGENVMAAEIERLQERVENLRQIPKWFAGTRIPDDGSGPSIRDVLNRANAVYDGGGSLPIEWLTVMATLASWEKEALSDDR